MPIFYFNIYNDDVTLDDEGLELRDERAAVARGVVETRALAAETVGRGHFTCHHYVEIEDENHQRVQIIRFDEAVEIRK